MPEKIYNVRSGWGLYGFTQKGAAVDFCIKHDIPLDNIIEFEYETVAEYEKRTGVNYGCAPCDHLGNDCNGAKPGAFYYPNECPEFYNAYDEQQEQEYEEQMLEELYNEFYDEDY